MINKIFVIDTNVLLSDPQAIMKFDEHTVVIPLTVLEELDNQKSSARDIARDARAAIRQLDEVIKDLDPITDGVTLPTGGKLFVAKNIDTENTEGTFFTPTCPDDHIINVALNLQYKGGEVVLVSNDVCMRLKAKGIGVAEAQEFRSDIVVEDPELLPRGHLEVPDGWYHSLPIGRITAKSCGEVHIPEDIITELIEEGAPGLAINDWLINEDDKIAARLVDVDEDENNLIFIFENFDSMMSRKAAGIAPRNIRQAIALQALLDQDTDIVIMDAKAGSGKTLLAMAAACEMVKGKKGYRMDKVIYTRSNDSEFSEIGFLKGGEYQKMAPWLQAAVDNLEIISRESKKKDYEPKNAIDTEENSDTAFIQFKNLGFMRGRSINHKVLIIDEFQNLTASQAKTIITRAGQYCKVIILGNLGQIDNDYVSPRSSGLTYTTEKFHGVPFAKVMRLEGVQRSRVAEFAEENF